MGQSVWLTPGGGALGGPCLRRGTEGGRGAALGLTASAPQMPVCSYFLKGVCSNSNCPYSHVYVSRKAEVCTDFLRGYCPLGAKVRGLGWGAPGARPTLPWGPVLPTCFSPAAPGKTPPTLGSRSRCPRGGLLTSPGASARLAASWSTGHGYS